MKKRGKRKDTDVKPISIHGIPQIAGLPILGPSPTPAHRIAEEEIVYAIKHQFEARAYAFRELAQNSRDAGATKIRLDLRYEDGRMIAEFRDDGSGMTRQIIERNYLVIFDSSKDGEPEGATQSAGFFGIGRLSALTWNPEYIEVITLTAGELGYRVVIYSDLSGDLWELLPEEAQQEVMSPHGTLVRLVVPMADEDTFLKEVTRINQVMDREACWISPEVTITEYQMEKQV